MEELLALLGLTIWLALATCPVALTSCCCGGCTYFSDNFSTDNLATDYTLVRGTWNVTGGKLTTSSSNALLLVNIPSLSTNHRVTLNVSLAASGDGGRVVFGYTDDDNYLFLELVQGAASKFVATCYERVSGVETQIGVETIELTSTAGEEIPVSICVNGEVTTVTLDDLGSDYTWRISTVNHISAGTIIGLGTNAVASGVSFDSLFFYKEQTDDPICLACGFTCNSYCQDGTYPRTVEITLGNVADGPFCTGDCAPEFETTYILDQQQPLYMIAGHPECTYGIEATGSICSAFASVLLTAQYITSGTTIDWRLCISKVGIFLPFSVCGTATVSGRDCTTSFSGTITISTGSNVSGCDFDHSTFAGIPVP